MSFTRAGLLCCGALAIMGSGMVTGLPTLALVGAALGIGLYFSLRTR